jgi:hypothetical protein
MALLALRLKARPSACARYAAGHPARPWLVRWGCCGSVAEHSLGRGVEIVEIRRRGQEYSFLESAPCQSRAGSFRLSAPWSWTRRERLCLIEATHCPVATTGPTPVIPVVLFRLALLFICCSEFVAQRQFSGSQVPLLSIRSIECLGVGVRESRCRNRGRRTAAIRWREALPRNRTNQARSRPVTAEGG